MKNVRIYKKAIYSALLLIVCFFSTLFCYGYANADEVPETHYYAEFDFTSVGMYYWQTGSGMTRTEMPQGKDLTAVYNIEINIDGILIICPVNMTYSMVVGGQGEMGNCTIKDSNPLELKLSLYDKLKDKEIPALKLTLMVQNYGFKLYSKRSAGILLSGDKHNIPVRVYENVGKIDGAIDSDGDYIEIKPQPKAKLSFWQFLQNTGKFMVGSHGIFGTIGQVILWLLAVAVGIGLIRFSIMLIKGFIWFIKRLTGR